MSVNPDSILDTVKKALGFESEYTAFDADITMLVNAAFGNLSSIGVGSDTGFVIKDRNTVWIEYVPNLLYQGMVKGYIFTSVKLWFDPPGTSFGINALEKQIEKWEFLINIAAEQGELDNDVFGDVTIFEGGIMKTFFAPKVVYLVFADVIVPDAADGNMFFLTLTGDVTLGAPVNGSDGEHVSLEIISNGHSVTWGEGWNFGSAGVPTLSSGGQADIVSAYFSEQAANWRSGFTGGF
jgi:hypothetical protein